MCIPFLFVFFYGIFTESVAICNSRKRVYIIMMGFIQVASLLTVSIMKVEEHGNEDLLGLLLWILTINSFAMAVSDTIIDGLMVI